MQLQAEAGGSLHLALPHSGQQTANDIWKGKKKMKEKSKLFVVDRSLALPLPYCLLSVLISRPPFSHLKEIVLLDPSSSTSFSLPCLPPSLPPSLVCHPAAALQRRRTAGAGNRKNNINSQEATSNVHHLAAPHSLVSPLAFLQESN